MFSTCIKDVFYIFSSYLFFRCPNLEEIKYLILNRMYFRYISANVAFPVAREEY